MEINPEFPLYHSKQRKICVKINSSPICWCNESTQKELLIRFSRTKAASSGAKTLTTLFDIKELFFFSISRQIPFALSARKRQSKKPFYVTENTRRKFYYAVSTKRNLLFAFHNCTRTLFPMLHEQKANVEKVKRAK